MPKRNASTSNPFTKAQNKGTKFPNKTGLNNKAMTGYNKNSGKVGGVNGSGNTGNLK